MGNSLSNPLMWMVLSLVTTAGAFVWSLNQGQRPRCPRWLLGLLLMPGVVVLASFYSLAYRMHACLGGWPDFNGIRRLPPELHSHAELALSAFGWVFLVMFVMPVLYAVFSMVPRLRPGMIYPSLFGAAAWLSLLATQLAPGGFLEWWWD